MDANMIGRHFLHESSSAFCKIKMLFQEDSENE